MATEPPKDGAKIPNVNAKIAELGPDFSIGLDTDRKWATGVQTFVTGPTALIVYREQSLLDDGNGGIHQSIKNVASVVLPTAVLIDAHKQLGELLTKLGLINGQEQPD